MASSIKVRTNDPYRAEEISLSIESSTGLDAVSWIEANRQILELLNTQAILVWLYYGLTTPPLKLEASNFFYAIVFSFVINVVAGVYPARRASRLDPVEAIESE